MAKALGMIAIFRQQIALSINPLFSVMKVGKGH